MVVTSVILNAIGNRRACIRHLCKKTNVLRCHRCLINTGVEKMNINMFENFDHQMPLSKRKCWYSNNGTNALTNVNNCLNTNIYSYIETSGGQSSNPYLNVVHFFQHQS